MPTKDTSKDIVKSPLYDFADTPAAEADVSAMGGGGLPFVPVANLVGTAFIIHNVEFHESVKSRFGDGPKWFVYLSFHESPNRQMYVATFSVRSPVAGQFQAFEDAGVDIIDRLPMGPVTLERQAKSYKLSKWVKPEL